MAQSLWASEVSRSCFLGKALSLSGLETRVSPSMWGHGPRLGLASPGRLQGSLGPHKVTASGSPGGPGWLGTCAQVPTEAWLPPGPETLTHRLKLSQAPRRVGSDAGGEDQGSAGPPRGGHPAFPAGHRALPHAGHHRRLRPADSSCPGTRNPPGECRCSRTTTARSQSRG